jgi:hypothetical protein
MKVGHGAAGIRFDRDELRADPVQHGEPQRAPDKAID